MKELILNINGGRPLTSSDLGFIQESYTEMIKAIINGININNSTAYILYGCNITVNDSGGANPTLDLTEGALYYDNEIFYVDAVSGQALPAGTTQTYVRDNYLWDLSEISSNTRIFKDTTSHNVWNTRKAVIGASSSTWIAIKHLREIRNILNNETTNSIVVYEKSSEILNTNGTSASGYYSITSYSGKYFNKSVVNGCDISTEVSLASGIPYPVSKLRISFNSAFILSTVGTTHPIMINVLGTLHQGYYTVISNTPSTIDIYRLDGANFTAGQVVTLYLSTTSCNF